jgi:DNA (cytosine-5)-methyltransferase 1
LFLELFQGVLGYVFAVIELDAHRFAVVAPHLVEVANSNWSNGHRPADIPAPTITAHPKGGSWAMCSAFLAKHYGGVVGHGVYRPIGTVTAVDHHSVVAAHLTKFYGTNTGSDCREPMPTVTAGGWHIGEVRAFLIKYFGCGCGQTCTEPLHTVTTRDRFGLVTVAGQEYQIVDIGLRMLTPRELLRAQFGPELAADYVLPKSASAAVAKIGNSVAPLVAAALVRANMTPAKVAKGVA